MDELTHEIEKTQAKLAELVAEREKRDHEKAMRQAAANAIKEGVDKILKGFSFVMKPEEVAILEKRILNPNIVEVCYNIVQIEKAERKTDDKQIILDNADLILKAFLEELKNEE